MRAGPGHRPGASGLALDNWHLRLRVLHSVDESAVGRSLLLPNGGRLRVGREVGPAGLKLDDPRLSRRHLTIEGGRTPRVSDHDTKNGTRVNRSQLKGTMEVWGDALIEMGQTILHLGYDVDGSTGLEDGVDPLITAWAKHMSASAPVVGICAASGVGRRTLCRQFHRRAGRDGGLLFLDVKTASHALLAKGLPLNVGGTVAVLGAEDIAPETVNEWLHAASLRDTRVILVGPELWQLRGISLPPAHVCTLPGLHTRRATVWDMTRLWLRHRRKRTPLTFSRGALAVWLSQPMEEGWAPLRERLERLLAKYPVMESLRSTHVRSVLPASQAREVLLPSNRQMEAPTVQELKAALARYATVREVAEHFGRPRRQVYRWMRGYGLTREAGDSKGIIEEREV